MEKSDIKVLENAIKVIEDYVLTDGKANENYKKAQLDNIHMPSLESTLNQFIDFVKRNETPDASQ